MVFTKEEEDILRLVINELRTRKKLDAKREEKHADFKSGMLTVNNQIDSVHKTEFDLLQVDYDKAEKDIEEMFE